MRPPFLPSTRTVALSAASVLVTTLVAVTPAAWAAAPANDDFAGAIVLTSGSDTAIDLTQATQEAGEVDGGCALLDPSGGTTWYKFTAPADTVLDAYDTAATATSGVSVDFVDGTSASAFNTLTCAYRPLPSSDDVHGYGARYVTQAAQTVYLRVSGYGSTTGTVHFEAYDVSALRPTNDDVADAAALPLGSSFRVDTQFATSQTLVDGPSSDCPAARTTWYTYRATASGVLSVGDQQPFSGDSLPVAAFRAPGGTDPLVCGPRNGSISPALGAGLRLRVTAGSDYLIRFGSDGTGTAQFKAVFAATSALPGDTVPSRIPATGRKTVALQLATSDLHSSGFAYTAYYAWRAPASGQFRFSTRNSTPGRDTVLLLLDTSWNELAVADDEGPPEEPGDLRAVLDFAAQAGKTYYVALAEYGIAPGNVGPVLLGWGPKPTGIAPTVKPKVTGKVKVGRTLTATTGTWNPPDVTLTTAWLADGKVIKGATGTRLTLKRALKGKRITWRVKASYASVGLRPRTVTVKVGRVL
ncbi:hypothetical protein [Nocardioides rubriscoriae]|uniref:hypothetical protein n=1 Tax=Nocardioides rubriscoriae TaxID=642762 RepID=UPI0011DF47CA|nr:hypothetical protein [Nocardioides rubriscoriae]